MNQRNLTIDPSAPRHGEPVWLLASLYPSQGNWTESDYLELNSGRLIEFDNGSIEVLPMPTVEHQRVVLFIYRLLFEFASKRGVGEVFVAPLPVRLREGKYREPNIVYLAGPRIVEQGYPDGADLVIEVVSEDEQSRRRDLSTKPPEYADAGISECWVVDPADQVVFVHTLNDKQYETKVFGRDTTIRSSVLQGLEVNVNEILASANGSDRSA